ncbi:MAG: arsenate reductase ArsC [Pseudomonadota bacterium]
MKKVLIIGERDGARSRMFEGFLRKYGAMDFIGESAGLEPARVEPLAVEVMREDGVDLEDRKGRGILEVLNWGLLYDYVITVCDRAAALHSSFPRFTHCLHLPFPDPASFSGTRAERLEQTRLVRDDIKKAVWGFMDDDLLFPTHVRRPEACGDSAHI